MSGSQQGPPSDQPSPSLSPYQPFLLLSPVWFRTQSSQRPHLMNRGAAAPFSLSTPAFGPMPNSPTQLQPSANSPRPMAARHSPESTTPTMNISPDTSRNILPPYRPQSPYTTPLNHNVPTHMNQEMHGAANRLNNSFVSLATGGMTQAENPAAEIPTGDSADEVNLDDPNFLDGFLPGETYHDEFYPSMNHPLQDQPFSTNNDPVPVPGIVPTHVHLAGEQLAEGHHQQQMFGDPAARNDVLDHRPNSSSATERHQNNSQYAEEASNTERPRDDLITYGPDDQLGEDFPEGNVHAAHPSTLAPETHGPLNDSAGALEPGLGHLINAQAHSSTDTGGSTFEVPQAAVGALQTAPSRDREPLASSSSGHVPLQNQLHVTGPPPSSAPSASQGRKYQEETCWVDGVFYHRMNEKEYWYLAVEYGKIRASLLERAKRRSRYRFPPPRGESEGDETAPLPAHSEWAYDREHRPAELFMFDKPLKYQAVSERFSWYYDRKRVIDREGKWMGYWHDVPVTISSNLAGWQLEAYTRRNPDLRLKDLLGRMLDKFLARTKRGALELQGPWDQSVMTNRSMRFRWDTFNIAWQRNCDGSKRFRDYFETKLPQWCKDQKTTFGFRDLYWYERRTIRKIHSGVPLAEALRKESQLIGTAQNIDDDAESQDVEDVQGDGPDPHEEISYEGEVGATPQAESSSMGLYNPVRGMPLGTIRQHIEIIEISDDEAEQPQQKKRERSRTGSADGPNNRKIPRSRDEFANGNDLQAPESPRAPRTGQQARQLDPGAAQSIALGTTQSTTDFEVPPESAIFSGFSPVYLQVGISYTVVRLGTRAAQQVVVTSDKDQFWVDIDLTSLLQELQELEVKSRALERAKNKSVAAQAEATEPETVRYFLNKGDTYLIIAMDSHKTHKGFLAEEEIYWIEQNLEATIQDIQSLMSPTDANNTASSTLAGMPSSPGDLTTNDRQPSASHQGILANASESRSPIVGAEGQPNPLDEQSGRALLDEILAIDADGSPAHTPELPVDDQVWEAIDRQFEEIGRLPLTDDKA